MIVIGNIDEVQRNQVFSIPIHIEKPIDYVIDSIELKSIGAQDTGIILDTRYDTPIISGRYETIYNDNILYVNKGQATRLQIFEYDDNQLDGFAKNRNGEKIPLKVPLPLSDEKFAEEKIKFPSIVQPIKITSIEQLPEKKDLILGQQDARETITVDYQITIHYRRVDIQSGDITEEDSLIQIIHHTIISDTTTFMNILKTYYITDGTIAAQYAGPINIVSHDDGDSDDGDSDDGDSDDGDDGDSDDNIISRPPPIPEEILSQPLKYTVHPSAISVVEGEPIIIRCFANRVSSYSKRTYKSFVLGKIEYSYRPPIVLYEDNFVFEAGAKISNEVILNTTVDIFNESNQKYVIIFEGKNIPVLVLDKSRRKTYSNPGGINPVSSNIMIDKTGKPLIDENGVIITTVNMNQTVAQFNTKLDTHN